MKVCIIRRLSQFSTSKCVDTKELSDILSNLKKNKYDKTRTIGLSNQMLIILTIR